ncbi:cathelicidin-6-like [Dendropsophus ebraccatus]|uniref:cathelicidin-6-like n=1 Tax=Dendropsophus ebraccatus TaxID=150705 RepID=UPI003831DD3B
MLGWRLSLLLLAAVTLSGHLSAEPDVLEEKSIRDIVHLYNQREGVTYLYRALEQLSALPLEEDEEPKRRKVIIRETVCPKSENTDISKCDFKADGDVKICSLDRGDEDIICTSVYKDVRVKRSSRRPCTGRKCRPWLAGGSTLIGRPANNNNRAGIIWV